MLGRISNSIQCNEIRSNSPIEDRYSRNELDDLKKGIEYLYEFKDKLCKLHPSVLDIIENMLQKPRY